MDTVERLFGLKPLKPGESQLKNQGTTFDQLIAGIELEIENVGRLEQAETMCDNLVWVVKEDGSLRPRHISWEFVSVPLPMSKLVAEMDRFFQNTHFTDANYSDRTSIHVHTNVHDFTKNQIANLCLIYTTFEAVVFDFVNTFNRGNRESFFRDTNVYCIPWTHCRLNEQLVTNYLLDPKYTSKTWEKYTALNLLPMRDRGSVEWRHMHGTNDMQKLRKWLDVIGCIMKFAKEQDYAELEKTINTLNDTSAYQNFFNKVFGGTLDYSQEYAVSMSEGVINAKLAIINKDKKLKDKAPIRDDFFAAAFDEVLDGVEEEVVVWNANPQPLPLGEAFPMFRPAHVEERRVRRNGPLADAIARNRLLGEGQVNPNHPPNQLFPRRGGVR